MKLFGGSKGKRTGAAVKKKKKPLKVLAIILICVLLVEGLYFTAIYSNNAFITKWRNIYITTAMDTLSHQWLAKAFIPEDVINEVMRRRDEALESQEDLESAWTKDEEAIEQEVIEFQTNVSVVGDDKATEEADRLSFYSLFHELDQESFEAYLDKHPEALDNGWANLVIDESGLDEDGTDILTVHGEQVLTIDVPNKILLLRIEGSGYRGVMAVAKDPSRLSLRPSSQLGKSGETVGTIASANNGVLAMTGSGFIDPEGGGNGGILAGYAMCDGVPYGSHATRKGDKRMELHEDDLMYIYDPSSPVAEDCTDAVEWQPAIIIDGQDVLGYGWDGLHPRACIGQSDKYEVLMLIIEGRFYSKGIIGITLYDCADILLRHGCMQAINLDGGTSAIMWYNGETVTNCSNTRTPEGRLLPTAFVYGKP